MVDTDEFSQADFEANEDVVEESKYSDAGDEEKSEMSAQDGKTKKKRNVRRKKKKKRGAATGSRHDQGALDALDGELQGVLQDQDAHEDEEYDPDAETRRRLLSRSQRLMEQRFLEREAVKRELLETRANQRAKLQRQRIKKEVTWKAKLEKSPFLVNLMAENERIEEENRARLQEAARRDARADRRRAKIKNDIIIKALQEASDLDALRAEKRLIMEEERRLKALIEVEKTNLNRKQDLMAAMRAEKQRKHMQQEFRRQKRMQFEKEMREQRTMALKAKLGLEE
ncbi:Hypothetical Protein FCC1311_082762 [Hondaea fermentalgiana]|uniref:Uncharacterized protein n=1 Tax=Hondaea fermentalgiana TaxID=2315210 RepID=A0A2R5GUJ5_9STRA|nr:Hypothetical Protein FCC1311_082762 [Hondaea fermentalgiana]|eukprot:GBG32051.1 Hypothetical Protein FCC1311_082762 [Hondaea fermentalgiana]